MESIEKDSKVLRECPFCGGKVQIIKTLLKSYTFMCDNCGANVLFNLGRNEGESIESWNRRTRNEQIYDIEKDRKRS